MSRITAAITGVAGHVPDGVITNADLEKMVDTNDEWIRTRTGISERRYIKDPKKATSDMGAEAVKLLLEKTNTDPKDVELIVCATISGDYVFPDTGALICDKTGCTNAYGLEVRAACSGFLFALSTGVRFIESGAHKKVIVVGADCMSRIVDYQDRSTCIIFGDGAGAVMLEPNVEGFGVQDVLLKSDGSGYNYLHMKAGGSAFPATHETVDAREHYIFQDGQPVFRMAVRGMSNVISELLDRNHLEKSELDWLVPHQANIRIIQSIGEFLNFPSEKVMVNIQKYGNTTAGTIPLCLWEYEPQLKKGDKLILTAFGGGFTWGAIYLTWAY
ncbi:MAG: ketoacyl-ACP synthase III [Saprospiraceae bacterium]|nr:ketoacyl-ACP synthase III [Saprospiraceae bacterium]